MLFVWVRGSIREIGAVGRLSVMRWHVDVKLQFISKKPHVSSVSVPKLVNGLIHLYFLDPCVCNVEEIVTQTGLIEGVPLVNLHSKA